MSDLISRKALIESLKGVEIEQWLNDDGTLSDDYYHTTVVEHIEEQPSVNQWIPIGQYPTEQSLLCFENGEMVVGKYDFEADEWDVQCSSEYFSCLDITDDEPIAWMPLPEPYGKE